MNKILLSWYATVHDFKHSDDGLVRKRLLQVSENGPTVTIHTHHWENYEKHIILFSNKEGAKPPEREYADELRSYLQKHFREHSVEFQELAINDPINLEEISHKTQTLLAELTRHYYVDIFISPGTPAMQMAWIINGLNFKDKVTLFQGREGKYSKSGKHEKVFVNLDSSIFPTQLNIALALEANPPSNSSTPSGLRSVYELASRVANTNNATCLILGPNGSGKERLAKYIHDSSSRRDMPYMAVNCAAFPDELLASELFGHKKGSFTGAEKDRIGILESADGGTVLLDEIGDITPKMQIALLRVLQEKQIKPLGSNEIKKIDVRIIAATNRKLIEEAQKGNFRWDLYYRLNVAPLEIQPLFVQGRKVIKEWINIKIDEYAKEFGNMPLNIEKESIEALCNYNWPGNIRELEHTILRLYIFRISPSQTITKNDLPSEILQPAATSLRWQDVERNLIEKVMSLTGSNISRSFEILGIARNTLKTKLKKYGIHYVE